MKRPNRKDYIPTDFIKGKYENDLESYIDYLENTLGVMNLEVGDTLLCRVLSFKKGQSFVYKTAFPSEDAYDGKFTVGNTYKVVAVDEVFYTIADDNNMKCNFTKRHELLSCFQKQPIDKTTS